MDTSIFHILIDQTVNGLVIGNIYALIAVGLALIFGAANLINFAHGSVFMAGAFSGWFFLTKLHLPLAVALILASGVAAILGIAIEWVGVSPFRKKARIAPLLATLGIGMILDQAAQIIFGPFTQSFPTTFPIQRLNVAGVSIGWIDILIAAVAFISTGLLFIFLKFTKAGQAIRASAQDAEAAAQMGIRVNTISRVTFAVASALGGLGGVLIGIYYNNISPTMGFQAGLKGFTACILGGLGNIPGAVAGGIVLGVIESWGVGLLGSTYRNLFAFSLLILALMIRPNGIFNRSRLPAQEPLTGTFIPNTRPVRIHPALIGSGFVAAVVLPLVLPNPYLLQILTNVWTYGILAVSLTLVAGTVGITSLGHAGLLALGAYTSAIVTMKLGMTFGAGVLSAGLMTALIGTLLILPSFKLKGDYIAIATLGVGEIINQVILNWDSLTGGPSGISNIAPPALFGIQLVKPAAFYWLSLGFLTIGALLIAKLSNTVVGRVLRAIRDDETAARSFGIRPAKYKALAYAISGFVAGCGGALTAHMYSYINNETFNSSLSIMGLTSVILGGMGNVAGAITGTSVLVVVPELLRGFTQWRGLFYGIILLIMLRFKPQGILGAK
jgi:branched-chain amino acid transport system permease protein